ncbi:MAG: hypothetical protein RIS47_748 [Bacteroidota bacterium]|jgi:nitrogen regulatory protein PII 2
MKNVMAIIRIDRMNQTKQALKDIGISSMTATGKVFGRGKGLWEAKVLEAARKNEPEAIALLGSEPRLRPQRVVQIIVPDSRVDDVVQTLIEVNQTPAAGDGKIFVLPVYDAIRIRTTESGDTVLDQ